MKGTEVLFSSKSDEWATPQDLFDNLNGEFKFTMDACATAENAKCERYYTKENDGLSADWGGESVFCNPPYSEIGKWVKKSFYESQKDNTTVCLLIPSRTDTRWFHDYIYNRCEIRFIKGRLRFSGAKSTAPFPSMVCVFRGAGVNG